MTNLIKRALTGAIYVALIVCSLLFGGVWAFPLLCCLLAAGAITEFCKLGSPEGSSPLTLFLDILLSVGIFVTPHAFYASGLSAILLLAALCLIFVALCVVSVSTSRPDPFGSLVSSLASIFYIVMPLALAVV
ncbi:MAG: phosphatidate cytidylyltransferase, partial [Paramuribaculum sp.]|nr:phosphatidate cytidylyltransferase [Paramuribaculum sp.]